MATEGISRYDQVPPPMSDEMTGASWATGFIFFAASIMFMVGIFQFFQGLAAILKGSFFVAVPNYAFSVDTSAWGWTQMLLGILMTVAGVFLFFGKLWARIVAIALTIVSAVTNFLTIPYYPVWSILIIVLDVVVLWALMFHGRDLEEAMR